VRSRTRYLVVAGAVAAVMLAAAGTLASAAHSPGGAGATLVLTKGHEAFETNALVSATFRFAPETISVKSGSRVTWKHVDSGMDPHTITILANRREFPHDFEGKNCKTCAQVNKAQFPNGRPPVIVLNKGASGLDVAGDSLFMKPKRNAVVSAVISAKPGTTLYYVCVIHPWMQATIKVT
jgi:plastocyanin